MLLSFRLLIYALLSVPPTTPDVAPSDIVVSCTVPSACISEAGDSGIIGILYLLKIATRMPCWRQFSNVCGNLAITLV